MRAVVQRVSEARVSDARLMAFGADMQVELVNDGPMTLVIDVDGTSG